MASTPHYFIAIHLPTNLQDYFSKWQEALHVKLPYKQWYNKKDLHITLKFLGAVEEDTLHELDDALKSIEQLSAFDFHVGEVGTFGSPNNPRVLWAGVDKTDALEELHELVEECTIKIGFSKENRAYRPHITLAKRWTGQPDADYSETLSSLKREFTNKEVMHVHEAVIFQIHPGRKQKYEPVWRYRLQ